MHCAVSHTGKKWGARPKAHMPVFVLRNKKEDESSFREYFLQPDLSWWPRASEYCEYWSSPPNCVCCQRLLALGPDASHWRFVDEPGQEVTNQHDSEIWENQMQFFFRKKSSYCPTKWGVYFVFRAHFARFLKSVCSSKGFPHTPYLADDIWGHVGVTCWCPTTWVLWSFWTVFPPTGRLWLCGPFGRIPAHF